MGAARIIDSHIHCGVQHSDLPFAEIAPLLGEAIQRTSREESVSSLFY